MSAVVVLDTEIAEDLASRGLSFALPTLLALVGMANAEGESTVGLRTLCAKVGRSVSTVERHISKLEGAGYLARVDGGYRGRCVTYVVKRWIKDSTAFVASKARRAVYAARRARWARLAESRKARREASQAGPKKVPMDEQLPIPSKDGEVSPTPEGVAADSQTSSGEGMKAAMAHWKTIQAKLPRKKS